MLHEEILESIRCYSREIKRYIKTPIFFDDDPHNIRLSFVKRINSGAESVMSLINKELHFDAHIIGGSLLEALSLLDYIISENKIEEYYYHGVIKLVKNMLYLQDGTAKKNKIPKDAFDYLRNHTAKFLKPKKDIQEVVAFIEDKKNTPQDKLCKIKDSYMFFSYPERNIRNYVDKTGNDTLAIAYECYCEMKHYSYSVFDYMNSQPIGTEGKHSEECFKNKSLALIGLVLFYTNQMIQKWSFDEEGLKRE